MDNHRSTLGAAVPRLALRPSEAAAAIGCSPDFFSEHVDAELRWCRRGRVRLVALTELQRWLEDNAERLLDDRRPA